MKVARKGKERNDRVRVRKKGRKGQEAGSDSLSHAARLFPERLRSDLGFGRVSLFYLVIKL